jgi:hypothetical protein
VGVGQSIVRTFIATAVQCIKEQGTKAVVEAAEEIAGAAKGTVAQSAFKSQLSKAGAFGIVVATTACNVASSQLADAVSTLRDVDYENACSASAFSFKNKNRVAACMKTAGSACAAYGGAINAADLAGLDPETVSGFFSNAAGSGLSVACLAGGPATRVLCGTINQAALQIKQALTTGTNDWATCLPTAQLGACIGTLYATWESGGWTNNEGVEMATGEGDEERRACCWCYKDTYKDDGFFYDTPLSRENWFGVIQSGDFASSNCAWMERKGKQTGALQSYTADGYGVYWRYSECSRAVVRGGRCAPGPDGTVDVWNADDATFSPVVVPVR